MNDEIHEQVWLAVIAALCLAGIAVIYLWPSVAGLFGPGGAP